MILPKFYNILSGFCILIIFLLMSCREGYAFNIQHEHPRLINRALLQGIEKDRNKNNIAKQIRKDAKFNLPTPESELFVNGGGNSQIIKMFGIAYLIEGKDKYYHKAKTFIEYMLSVAVEKTDYQIISHLEALAYYYDMFYDVLEDEEKDKLKIEIFDRIKLLQNKKKGLLNYGGSHFHYTNRMVVIASLSIFEGDSEMESIINTAYQNMISGFVPFFKFLSEDDGGFHMGWEYSRYYIKGICEFFDVWRNATGEDLFAENQWLNKTFYFLLYGMRDDKTNWGTGDNHARHAGSIEKIIFQKLAMEYNNGYAQYAALDFEKKRRGWPSTEELFYDLFWKDESVQAVALENLPLVKPFERAGAYIFKEGWEGQNVTALFKNTPTYFFNHAHRDANHFEIWFKDDLAIDSGFYDAYWSSHWFNYYIRTVAHNTVTIFDPQERLADWDKIESNDGGQLFSQTHFAQPHNVAHLQNGMFNIAETKLIEDNENYALAVGDATRAYSAHKCELFKRHFLWLKKVENWDHPIIVVFDQVVSTKPEFEKRWLLHSIHKPEVKDNVITIKNGGGKLWNYIIQPQEFAVDVIGGKGREFEVNGINYPVQKSIHGGVEKAGAWRVELTQKTPAKAVNFLNVLVPTEKKTKKPPMIERISNGVRIENWSVVFENDRLNVETK